MSLLALRFDKEAASREGIAEIELPGSKSMAARALILNYIKGESRLPENMPDCDDTRELRRAVGQLAGLIPSLPEWMKRDEHPVLRARFDLGTGATSLRFFTALVASIPGLEAELVCSEGLRRRPLAPLLDALRTLGAEIRCPGEEGHAPLYIRGKKLRGGEVEVDGNVSSQFASALLMASLLWERPAEIRSEGMVSESYYKMTERMMRKLPVREIETDWSAAAFFYEYALLNPGKPIYIRRLTPPQDSVQGDSWCCRVFGLLGVETSWLPDGVAMVVGRGDCHDVTWGKNTPLRINMGDVPDMVPALAVALALRGVKYKLEGVSHLIYKESNRLEALVMEMGKIGYVLESAGGELSWDGGRLPVEKEAVIECHGDHRMAMSMSMAVVKTGSLALQGAECVSKSFPGFYRNLGQLGIICDESSLTLHKD